MKIRFWFACSLLTLLLPTMVHAQVSIDVTKITCRQFLTGRMLPTKSMALKLHNLRASQLCSQRQMMNVRQVLVAYQHVGYG